DSVYLAHVRSEVQALYWNEAVLYHVNGKKQPEGAAGHVKKEKSIGDSAIFCLQLDTGHNLKTAIQDLLRKTERHWQECQSFSLAI
ncbi:mCG1027203, partial [Mus musculus]